jgi:transcriptional regulator with XRE-family HTH domain
VGNDEGRDLTYNESVGQRLRSIRKQRGLSLQDVEEISGREFKASVLGAYERGERALSLPRLQRLAAFFNVSAGQLLPQEEAGEPRPTTTVASGGVTVDLNKIDSLTGREAKLLEDFLRAIQMMRQDFNGRVLTIRRNDLRLLSLLLHQAEEDFSRRLTDLGVTTA